MNLTHTLIELLEEFIAGIISKWLLEVHHSRRLEARLTVLYIMKRLRLTKMHALYTDTSDTAIDCPQSRARCAQFTLTQ